MSQIVKDITKESSFVYPISYAIHSKLGRPKYLEMFHADLAMRYFNVKEIEKIKYERVLPSLEQFYTQQSGEFYSIVDGCTYTFGDGTRLKDFKLVEAIKMQFSKKFNMYSCETRTTTIKGESTPMINSDYALTKYPSREVLLNKYNEIQNRLNKNKKDERDRKLNQLGTNYYYAAEYINK